MIRFSKLLPCELLKKYKGGIILTKDLALEDNIKAKYIIVPSQLIDSRRYSSKINSLITYRMMQHRKTKIIYIISGNDVKQIDKRIRIILKDEVIGGR